MPELAWLYLTALLYYRTSASCVALAKAVETVSHTPSSVDATLSRPYLSYLNVRCFHK
jgi:hypothetical protein